MRIYFYPSTTKRRKDIQNPYSHNFLKALEKYHEIINKNDPSSIGILKTGKYLNKIDLIVFNWIEDLPDKKGGYLQCLYFVFLIYYLKIRQRKVLWILHNKLSHYKSNVKAKKMLFRFLLRKSDLIITHAKDGIDFGKSFYPKRNIRIEFFPHPTIKQSFTPVENKNIDILIWGAITEYKGIDKFLEYLYRNHIEKKYKILIAGKINSAAYRTKLMKMANHNIIIEDRFLEKDQLINYIQQSRVVLFTYSNNSVLSSGALVDTLTYKGTILGPNTGSFKDLAEEKIIRVYNDLAEVSEILDHMISLGNSVSNDELNSYFEKTNWNNFIIFINGLLGN